MAWKLYDFIDERGRNLVSLWLDDLDNGVRGRVKAKLQTLVIAGPELPGNLITPTKEPHIREIVVNLKAGAFRLFACRGPTHPLSEFTLICGGREKDSKYITKNWNHLPADAEDYRQELVRDITNRRREHEYFKGFLE